MKTAKKNKYSHVPINITSKDSKEDCSVILTKIYEIILSPKANAS